MLRSWRWAGFALAVGVFAAGTSFAAGGWSALVVAEIVLFVALAFLWSPLAFPRSIGAADAQQRSGVDGRPVIYWRPGCPYCQRLRLRLGRHGRRAHWVNIWTDPAGAAAVRAIAGGNETVPTVVVDGESRVNPDPAWLLGRLRA
ncbi:membrane protein [Asanoa ishikariensis]|uniref:Mycoredoxin n=1 Tax=Asanoa ishikariensis TaxID=137265 RepID=A0A1H3V027_9ACTN|nr:glutaredoxin domain-containing protein [Asanoa ishikariensis]GIF70045.1 membrane protein [Asanoa ishikariensis]SDZ67385.1 mycoredoxin [Asanoa ishikariensis]